MNKVYFQGRFYLKKEAGTEIPIKDVDITKGEFYYNPNYESVCELHQLIINSKGMFLRRRDALGKYSEELIPVNEDDLEKNYIDFMKFLKESKYIGKLGKRTKPTQFGDMSYTDFPTLVLFQTNTHTIIYNSMIEDLTNIPISILDSRYCNDWEFFGEQNTIYQNPMDLYKDLYKDSFKQNKNKGFNF